MSYIASPVGNGILCVWYDIKPDKFYDLDDILAKGLEKDNFTILKKFQQPKNSLNQFSFTHLAESHALLKSVDRSNSAVFDLHSCRKIHDGHRTYEYLKEQFKPSNEIHFEFPIPVEYNKDREQGFAESVYRNIRKYYTNQREQDSNERILDNFSGPYLVKSIQILYNIDKSIIDDSDKIKEIFVDEANKKIQTANQILIEEFDPGGISISALYGDNNISIHTYPEHNSLVVDNLSFTGDKENLLSRDIFKEKFKSKYDLFFEIPIPLDNHNKLMEMCKLYTRIRDNGLAISYRI